MFKEYNKLVRDGVPGHLQSLGLPFESRTLEEGPFLSALRDKLREEVKELLRADTALERLEEAADVLTVVEALVQVNGRTMWDLFRKAYDDRLRTVRIRTVGGKELLEHVKARLSCSMDLLLRAKDAERVLDQSAHLFRAVKTLLAKRIDDRAFTVVDLLREKKRKDGKKGRFDQRTFLVSVDSPDP